MNTDRFFRGVLWVSAVFNTAAALAFAFPESVGQLASLPVPVHPLYAWMLAALIFMFGGMYAYLASQLQIDRSLVALGAIGKALVFIVYIGCWLMGHVPLLAVPGAIVDLIFATIFTWWLVQSSKS